MHGSEGLNGRGCYQFDSYLQRGWFENITSKLLHTKQHLTDLDTQLSQNNNQQQTRIPTFHLISSVLSRPEFNYGLDLIHIRDLFRDGQFDAQIHGALIHPVSRKLITSFSASFSAPYDPSFYCMDGFSSELRLYEMLRGEDYAINSSSSTIPPHPQNTLSPLLPSLHPYPTLNQNIPTTLHQFTAPRDPISTQPLPVNPYISTTTSALSRIAPSSHAATIFVSSFHLLIELFHVTTVDFHKLILFEWFGIYSTLIQTHLYLKFLEDVQLNQCSLSEEQIHHFFSINSTPPQLSGISSATQPGQSFVLPVGTMIDFTKHKDEALTSIIISYNHLISLQSISHLQKFISHLYMSPQRSFWLIPVPIVSLFLTTPLVFELFDTLPQKLLQFGLLQKQLAQASSSSPLSSSPSSQQQFVADELNQLSTLYSTINSPYLVGFLNNHFIPHEFTSSHPLFPTEPQLLVQEEKNVISQFFSFLSTQTPATLPTDNLNTPLIMDRVTTHLVSAHSRSSSLSFNPQPDLLFSTDFSLPQYEQKWTHFSHGLLLSTDPQ